MIKCRPLDVSEKRAETIVRGTGKFDHPKGPNGIQNLVNTFRLVRGYEINLCSQRKYRLGHPTKLDTTPTVSQALEQTLLQHWHLEIQARSALCKMLNQKILRLSWSIPRELPRSRLRRSPKQCIVANCPRQLRFYVPLVSAVCAIRLSSCVSKLVSNTTQVRKTAQNTRSNQQARGQCGKRRGHGQRSWSWETYERTLIVSMLFMIFYDWFYQAVFLVLKTAKISKLLLFC